METINVKEALTGEVSMETINVKEARGSDDWITQGQLASRWQVSSGTIINWRKAGQLLVYYCKIICSLIQLVVDQGKEGCYHAGL